jgi:CheY-like chemotaxis protein
VLVVDDQPANLVALDAVLSPDFEVTRAQSGEQALSILEARGDIDVILLDVQMPGMDGFEAAARVKHLPGCKDIPIVFVTAVYHKDPFVKQGYQAGAVDYFSKPFDPDVLRAKVGIYAAFRQKSDLLREWERQIQASQELLRTGRAFAAMLERLPMSLVIMDASGRIERMGSEPIDPALDWWDAGGALREGRSSAIARIIEEGGTSHETVEVQDAEGASRSLLCTASALRERDGRRTGIALIVRDVTERNRLQLALERQIAGLASA